MWLVFEDSFNTLTCYESIGLQRLFDRHSINFKLVGKEKPSNRLQSSGSCCLPLEKALVLLMAELAKLDAPEGSGQVVKSISHVQ